MNTTELRNKWEDVFIGTTPAGEKIYLSVELRFVNDGQHVTIDHEPIDQYVRLSMQGVVIKPGGNIRMDAHWLSAGQIDTDHLRNLTPPGGATPQARRFTREQGRTLADVWDRWHLNDMRAGCAHMPVTRGSYDDHKHDVCSAGSGYRFGSAWLVEPLPQEVITEIRSILP